MKTQDNRPQWLIDAENEIKNFENTKFGKMTDKELVRSDTSRTHGGVMNYVKENPEHQKKAFAKMIENNPDHQSKAGKLGGSKGGKITHENLLEKLGQEEYNKLMKERLYNNLDKDTFHKKGNLASQESRRKVNTEKWEPILKEVPTEFTLFDTASLMEKHNKGSHYMKNIMNMFPDQFQLIGKITQSKGGATNLYRKLIYK